MATNEQTRTKKASAMEALAVLKELYDKVAKGTSLLHQQPEAPTIFDEEPYRGMGAESDGVVGMIEVTQSDFARLESETTAAELKGQFADAAQEGAGASLIQKNVALRRMSQLSSTFGACSWRRSLRSHCCSRSSTDTSTSGAGSWTPTTRR